MSSIVYIWPFVNLPFFNLFVVYVIRYLMLLDPFMLLDNFMSLDRFMLLDAFVLLDPLHNSKCIIKYIGNFITMKE